MKLLRRLIRRVFCFHDWKPIDWKTVLDSEMPFDYAFRHRCSKCGLERTISSCGIVVGYRRPRKAR